MESADYLVIGGGIAGTNAAETLRSLDADAKIAIEKVFLRNVAQYQSQNIDLYTETIVAMVDTVKKEVLTKNNKQFAYKKLLVASGGTPRKLSEVFSSTTPIEPLMMRNVEDMDVIYAAINGAEALGHSLTGEAKKVLIVGESFIALEFLEIFSLRGFEVHML